MSKFASANTKLLHFRPSTINYKHPKSTERYFKFGLANQTTSIEVSKHDFSGEEADNVDENKKSGLHNKTCLWVPHKRTGIYYPVGHEKVMEDVPEDAAKFRQTHWLRADGGVDKPSSEPEEVFSLIDLHDHAFV